jgi:hypothetical protein
MELSVEQAASRLCDLNAECLELKIKLFELSCDIQKDFTTVDFGHLGAVMHRLKTVEAARATLLNSLSVTVSRPSTEADGESEPQTSASESKSILDRHRDHWLRKRNNPLAPNRET